WRTRLGDDVPVLVTSAATGAGTDELARELLRRVPLSRAAAPGDRVALDDSPGVEHRVFRPAANRGFRVQRRDDGVFCVEGDGVERLLMRHDLDNDESLAHVEGRLRRMGIITALEAQGFEPGDDVEIAGIMFELHPG
ncbi:MAG TPA: Obg family GTPase CgtA, partial [Solirubrobacteraceae bacterium]|nr:Obg family GTPase CgtA [Solirubrobacteraceae bacterium]